MSQNDPFGRDSDATVIRPTPGARRGGGGGGGGATAARPAERYETERFERAAASPVALPQTGINGLVAAASPLLTLATRIKGTIAAPNIENLHARILQEFSDFERRAGAAGIQPKQIGVARYALAALIDDLVQNTPWGSGNVWAYRSMVHTFHRETIGGERFFDLLADRLRDPSNHLEMLELMYLCLQMGFEGRFRVESRGASELVRVRENLYQTIRNLRGDYDRDLSPHWPGVDSGKRRLTSYLPVWVVAAGCAAALVALFTGFYFALNGASDTLLARLASLPPALNVAVAAGADPMPPPTQAIAVADDGLQRVSGFLEPEVKAGLVEVFGTGNSVTVRLVANDPPMFASAKDELNPQYLPLLRRIGEALNDEPGKVTVVGHSDNVPLRPTLRFPSNYALSLARAETVRQVVAGILVDPTRMTAEGRGDAEPIADNGTPEGRARNRRVEVTLVRQLDG